MDYYDFGLADGLVKAGARPTLFTNAKTHVPAAASCECACLYRGIYGPRPALWRALRYVWATLRVLHRTVRTRTPICHYQFFHVGVLEWMCMRLARLTRRHVVVTLHDIEPLGGRQSAPRCLQAACRLASRVIVHNEASRRELTALVPAAQAKCRVVRHGNYLHAIGSVPSQVDARRELGLPAGSRVLLFFGQKPSAPTR